VEGAIGRLFNEKRCPIEGDDLVVIASERLEQAEASYVRLTAQHAKSSFESIDAEARLLALVKNEPLVELKTKSQRLFFVTRTMSDAGVTYRVFRTELSAIIGEEAIGFCDVGRIVNGIAVITNAEVQRSFQSKGIATAVYDLISLDMVDAGALLWPVPPRQMTDAEFKIWWRRSPALVFYYPHRYRLGLRPRAEFEELFDETVNRGFWDKAIAYCAGLFSRFKWYGGFGRFGR
jgi:ribosomal protein S18 acetylase RimI-like enzyme